MINEEIKKIIDEFKISENRIRVNTNPNFDYIPLNYKEKFEPKKDVLECAACDTGVSYLIPGKNIGICDQCNAIRIHINFTNYQKVMIKDKTEQKIYVAAPGVGKTTSSGAEWFLFANEFPNSTILCLAPTVINLRNVGQQELAKYFCKPEDKLDRNDFLICNDEEWKLKNGTRFLWIASDKEEKVRGENANGVWALEVNSFKPEMLNQLEIRTRSLNNATFEEDLINFNGVQRLRVAKSNRKIIFESNNDADYIRDAYVLNSKKVFYTNYVPIDKFILNHKQKETEIIGNRHTYLIDMISSPNQDEEYLINMLKKNTKENRLVHIFCDMFYQDREIILGWNAAIRYQLPETVQWKQRAPYPIFHITDFGQTLANTTILTIMFEPNTKTFWVIDEYYEAKLTVREHAHNMLQYKKKYNTVDYFEVVHAGDNSANQGTATLDEVTTLKQQYASLGVNINTKLKGLKHPDNAIAVVNKMIKEKKLFFFGECKNMIGELNKYRRQVVRKTGEKILPRGTKSGFTFDLIDSLYMFSLLVTLPRYEFMYSEDALIKKRENVIENRIKPQDNSSFRFLSW